MAFTDIDICSRALVIIGAEPITAFNEDTEEARVASNIYEQTVQALLTNYRWRFCMGQEQLSRLLAAPPDDEKWTAAYQIPDTVLHINTVRVNGLPIQFDRYEDKVYCDATSSDEVIIDAHYRVDEERFPAYFIEYLTYELAGLFAQGLAAKDRLSNEFHARAARQGAIARNMDSQGRSAARLDTSRFTRARFRNSYRNGDYYR